MKTTNEYIIKKNKTDVDKNTIDDVKSIYREQMNRKGGEQDERKDFS